MNNALPSQDIVSKRQYGNPFASISNLWSPNSMLELFDLCEYLYKYNCTYRSAIERAARLFLTEFKYESENTKSTDFLRDYFENSNFKDSLIDIGIDYITYGNSFSTIFMPFKRMVKCQVCKNEYPAEQVELSYNENCQFIGDCVCGAKGMIFGVRDIPDRDIKKINISRLSPKEMEIIYNKVSGNSTYIWSMSQQFRSKVKLGKGTLLINETPIEILNAVFQNKKIEFSPEKIMHLKCTSLSGTDIEWGMPMALSCFPLIFYITVLRKANEAISMDYLVPLRILFPNVSLSSQEMTFKLGDYANRLEAIIRSHKADPGDWHTSPLPIGYQTIGGEKRVLMVSDDIKSSNEELLNGMGFPAELFYGNMQIASTPMALRLLDNTFGLTNLYNKVLRFVVEKIMAYNSLEKTSVRISPLKMNDDIEKRQMVMQLSAARKVSDMSLLEMYDMNFEKEQEKIMKQTQILNKIQEKYIKDQIKMQELSGEQSGMQGIPSTPIDIRNTAIDMAQQLLNTEEGMRRSKLDDLLKTNPLLHDSVMGEMERQRNKMKTEAYHQQMMSV